MSTVFLPEFDAIVDEQEPEVIVDDTEFEHCIEITVPGIELHQFAVYALDHTLAVTCGEVEFRQELDLPDDVDTRHVTCNLDDGALEIQVPKLVVAARRD